MNTKMLNRMKNGKGFIAALDQSGGSSPKALALYGVTEDMYHNDDEIDFMKDPHVVRVVALSCDYPRDQACELLAQNPGLIASFSRALAQCLKKQQTDDDFNQLLRASIDEIYKASI